MCFISNYDMLIRKFLIKFDIVNNKLKFIIQEILYMNNKFTIITASSNKYPYLKDWMESIIEQKYRPLEVVMVDDCSEDKTRKLIKIFRKKSPFRKKLSSLLF